jgi:transcription initiation factor TFIIIB Brf1 subunit/transcription initiation factor TFIIB
MISYPERKILELKKKLETYASTKFNQAVLDDAIRLTKIARIDSPNRKNMDMAFLAAGCYYSCSTRAMPKTINEIRDIFDINTKENVRHLVDALKIVENIIIQKKYTIKINTEDGYIDDSGIPLAQSICDNLDLPSWATESILLILHKFYQKNILQNIIIKNKIGVVILFVFRYGKITNIPINNVLKQIGSAAISTIAKHCHTITIAYFDGIMKYINKKRVKYGLEPSTEVPASEICAATTSS